MVESKVLLNVLCLEDELKDAELLNEMLVDAGYLVSMDIAAGEKEYLSFLKGRDYDIILADYTLPGFDIHVALKWALELQPEVPFVCVSGTIGDDKALELLKQGATDYVLKNSLGWFVFAVRRALEGVEKQKERKKRAAELVIANKELVFQNEEKEKRAAELIIANKELEQFAYVASHDLQEPLRMVASYTQLLERRYKDKLDQDANDFIHYAVDGANRMQKLINDLLDYSRTTSHGKDFAKADISQVLGQAISNLQKLIIENNALITNEDLPELEADESQIIRVFQNLIGNAIKFKKKSELPKIHISCKEKNEFYEFAVRDNGIGIDMQFHDRVFTIFQRLHSKEEYPGTGIGLSICKRIIERHGGKIWFESKENEGTTFYFTLKI